MKKIVLVEDDTMLAEIYQARLKQAGYNCLLAINGVAGISTIKSEQPDLVLLDLMLPELSGEDVLKAMRSNDWGKNIPVLILTNISESEAPPGLRELGIEGYIVKANISNNQLDEIVNGILNKRTDTDDSETVAKETSRA